MRSISLTLISIVIALLFSFIQNTAHAIRVKVSLNGKHYHCEQLFLTHEQSLSDQNQLVLKLNEQNLSMSMDIDQIQVSGAPGFISRMIQSQIRKRIFDVFPGGRITSELRLAPGQTTPGFTRISLRRDLTVQYDSEYHPRHLALDVLHRQPAVVQQALQQLLASLPNKQMPHLTQLQQVTGQSSCIFESGDFDEALNGGAITARLTDSNQSLQRSVICHSAENVFHALVDILINDLQHIIPGGRPKIIAHFQWSSLPHTPAVFFLQGNQIDGFRLRGPTLNLKLTIESQ
jgi:hypothetical protein